MRCERFREAVSARLDGEPLGMSLSTLDAHLTSCPECAAWAEDAARVSRLLRMDARPVPNLSEEITAHVALPVRRVLRRRLVLRVLLLLAGLVQVAIGLSEVLGDDVGMAGMAMAAHAAHEAAAWNLAIGAAFVGAASVPRRATGLIPLLAVFLVVLGVLSVHDAADGAVGVGRLCSHAGAVVGLMILALLDRAERALPPGHVRAPAGVDAAEDGPSLRTVA